MIHASGNETFPRDRFFGYPPNRPYCELAAVGDLREPWNGINREIPTILLAREDAPSTLRCSHQISVRIPN